jgi:hypothetical protein
LRLVHQFNLASAGDVTLGESFSDLARACIASKTIASTMRLFERYATLLLGLYVELLHTVGTTDLTRLADSIGRYSPECIVRWSQVIGLDACHLLHMLIPGDSMGRYSPECIVRWSQLIGFDACHNLHLLIPGDSIGRYTREYQSVDAASITF